MKIKNFLNILIIFLTVLFFLNNCIKENIEKIKIKKIKGVWQIKNYTFMRISGISEEEAKNFINKEIIINEGKICLNYLTLYKEQKIIVCCKIIKEKYNGKIEALKFELDGIDWLNRIKKISPIFKKNPFIIIYTINECNAFIGPEITFTMDYKFLLLEWSGMVLIAEKTK